MVVATVSRKVHGADSEGSFCVQWVECVFPHSPKAVELVMLRRQSLLSEALHRRAWGGVIEQWSQGRKGISNAGDKDEEVNMSSRITHPLCVC